MECLEQKNMLWLLGLTLTSYFNLDKSLILSNKEGNQRLTDHRETKDINLHSFKVAVQYNNRISPLWGKQDKMH